MTPSNFRRPRNTGDALLRVKFRNGEVSKHVYPASKWEWNDKGFAYDIVAYEIDRGGSNG